MAVPTLDELHSYVEELIAGRQPEDQFYVFEWEFLVQMSRRHFHTTTPAIVPRMKKLLEEGDLAKVTVSHHGYAHLVENDTITYGMLSFQYTDSYREDYGYITANRILDRKNVWRDGNRYLFTTTAQSERMKAHFLKIRKERAAKEKAKDADEKARLWKLLEAASPGAQQVLDDLYAVLKGDGERRHLDVSASLWDRRDSEETCVEINTRSMDQSVRLIDIIRRGLASKEES